MTTQDNTIRDADEQWAAEFARREERRNKAIGIAIFVGIALFSIAFVLYFGGAISGIAW